MAAPRFPKQKCSLSSLYLFTVNQTLFNFLSILDYLNPILFYFQFSSFNSLINNFKQHQMKGFHDSYHLSHNKKIEWAEHRVKNLKIEDFAYLIYVSAFFLSLFPLYLILNVVVYIPFCTIVSNTAPFFFLPCCLFGEPKQKKFQLLFRKK